MTILLIIIATAATLRLMGRRVWCKCGKHTPWTSEITSGCTSQHGFDPYSATHFAHGVLLAAIPWTAGITTTADRLALIILSESVWEVIENTDWIINRYRSVTVSQGYFGDSVANSVCDMLCCLMGGWFATAAPVLLSAMTVIGIEILLVWLIRDNLTINLIMLVKPVPAIREWQRKGNQT